jgi:hypothetical protein
MELYIYNLNCILTHGYVYCNYFLCELKNSKILMARYENVHKFLETMPEFVWIWKFCEGQVVM